ncbi:Proteasome subunit beta type-3-like [Oopsacas minuta]|uniref:Proteasome subunit beta n=1 Tax=Oopsacas minuta TaxID=111878 RepID=A0AAV7JN07_9METZ|nr:Proteasome subunit beta type-3-like [Oopsacas minuta]
MSILEYNGSAIIAMIGKHCVAIASDKRLGIQAQTISTDFRKVFEVNSGLFLGLPGLATDVSTVERTLQYRLNLLQLRESRLLTPRSFMYMVSSLLYERRFGPYFVEPVIAGLDQESYQPFIATMDLIGCPMEKNDFVVSGTCSEQMYGMCESLWKPNLEPLELFEIISQALLNSVDRDALSGWGGIVHVVEKDRVTTKHLRARMD